ncbi:MAG: hypothetical protein WA637_23040 [Terriglobales bacterium]
MDYPDLAVKAIFPGDAYAPIEIYTDCSDRYTAFLDGHDEPDCATAEVRYNRFGDCRLIRGRGY